MKRFKTRVVCVLLLCSLLLASMLFYFMVAFDESKKLTTKQSGNSKPLIVFAFNEVRRTNETLKETYQRRIQAKLQNLPLSDSNDLDINIDGDPLIKALKDDLSVKPSLATDYGQIWTLAKKWVHARQTVPAKAPELGSVIRAMQFAKILKSDVSRKGTQLKLLLTLDGGSQKQPQFALFKPKRYSLDYLAEDIYAGADRHNGELISFHLSRILGMRFAPIVASRVVSVSREIKQLASPALLSTFVNQTQDNRTEECLYGECYYCSEYDVVCPDPNGNLEGALILMLPLHYKLQKLRNPWQRSYKKNVKTKWEDDPHYCLSVQKSTHLERLLDYVDTAIFDYLIGNADRHHFEVFKDVPNSALLLIDNGKSFGDHRHDEITILYPLLQCCLLRNSTYQRLRKVSNFKLSRIATHLLSQDILWPIVTEPHLKALDRRLVTVLAAVEVCFSSFNKNNVLKP